ncbi:MAG TPA: hypothetical protein DD658_06400 [Deltaproteobacteria bacterium]|nr:hypothetical protein [Deltaproteobacteria bacterium]
MAGKFVRRMIQTGSILLLAVSLFGGCAHTWSPKQAPTVPLESVGPLGPGLSVNLINDQPSTTPQMFAAIGGHTHYANYNEWTDFFIRYWGEALTKRGVVVGPQSMNTISVKLDDFRFYQGFAKVRTNMKIHLSSPDNTWKKDFDETDTSGWSMGRAFGSVIYHAVEKLMQDPEVLGRMKQ